MKKNLIYTSPNIYLGTKLAIIYSVSSKRTILRPHNPEGLRMASLSTQLGKWKTTVTTSIRSLPQSWLFFAELSITELCIWHIHHTGSEVWPPWRNAIIDICFIAHWLQIITVPASVLAAFILFKGTMVLPHTTDSIHWIFSLTGLAFELII